MPTGQWAHTRWYSRSCLRDLGPLSHLSPRGGRGSRGGPGWRAERRCVLAGATPRPLGFLPAPGCPPAPHLPGGPCLQVCQADPLHPVGIEMVSGGQQGGGQWSQGVLAYRGTFVTLLSTLSLRHRSADVSQGEKSTSHQHPPAPCQPPNSSVPWCPMAPSPIAALAPRYLLATQPGLPRGTSSARLSLLPWLPWVTLDKEGRGNESGQHEGSTGAAEGEKGLSMAPSTPRRVIMTQPAGTAPPEPNGQMDGQIDRGAMPPAVTLPLGHSCP